MRIGEVLSCNILAASCLPMVCVGDGRAEPQINLRQVNGPAPWLARWASLLEPNSTLA